MTATDVLPAIDQALSALRMMRPHEQNEAWNQITACMNALDALRRDISRLEQGTTA